MWCQCQPSVGEWFHDFVRRRSEGACACRALPRKGILFCVDINKVMENDTTALITAAFKGHVHIVEGLVKESGANINSDAKRLLPLVRRCSRRARSCRAMPRKGFGAFVNLKLITMNGSTPLMAAAERKHSEVIWLTKTALTPRHHIHEAALRLTSPKHMAPQKTAYGTWRRGRTALNPDALARGSRSGRLLRHLLLWQGVPGGALAGAQDRVQAERGTVSREGEVR
jgi:hypothetical protein